METKGVYVVGLTVEEVGKQKNSEKRLWLPQRCKEDHRTNGNSCLGLKLRVKVKRERKLCWAGSGLTRGLKGKEEGKKACKRLWADSELQARRWKAKSRENGSSHFGVWRARERKYILICTFRVGGQGRA